MLPNQAWTAVGIHQPDHVALLPGREELLRPVVCVNTVNLKRNGGLAYFCQDSHAAEEADQVEI
jgi:hypothetical protein